MQQITEQIISVRVDYWIKFSLFQFLKSNSFSNNTIESWHRFKGSHLSYVNCHFFSLIRVAQIVLEPLPVGIHPWQASKPSKGAQTHSILTHTWGSLESPINLINMFRLWEETGGNPCRHGKDMQTLQRKAPKGDFHHPHYLQNWFNEVLCICKEFLWRVPGNPRCEQNDINFVVPNNHIDQQCGLFCHDYLTVTETQSLHTEQKHQQERNTTRFEPERRNIFHSRSFYVGFKHAISQFNPIFPAFGVLQWNRFRLILNIWSALPLETPQPCFPPPHKSC